MNKDFEKAKHLIIDFIREHLKEDADGLEFFNFNTLENSEKFGCPEREFDCDDTNILRAFYIFLWGDVFPELTFDNCGRNKDYRGDTMNTFNTMFGRPIEAREGFFGGLEKYSPDNTLREKVRNFEKMIYRIGNYIVLPNRFIYCRNQEGKFVKNTLNTYRGCSNIHRDFFDRFLLALESYLTNQTANDIDFDRLMKQNLFAFDNIKGQEGFREFVRRNFLENYCTDSLSAKKIYPMNFHWMNVSSRSQYLSDAVKYISNAEQLIISRSRMMTAAIKKQLEIY